MSNIRVFNNLLNSSISYQSKEKQTFKEQVDVYIKSIVQRQDAHHRVCIIGSGKMDDFSLSFFVKFFDEIVVTDIDTIMVVDAIKNMRIPYELREKITVREVEYTGFSEASFFDDFSTHMVACKTFDEIDDFIERKMNRIRSYRFMEDEEAGFDFIYISPIYTQLIYNQVLRECSILRESGYSEHLLKYIEHKMLDEMIGVIDRFNSNVISLLHETGRLFVLSDIFQLDKGSKFDLRVKSGIKDKTIIDDIYETYKEQYGMGLGDYGLYNLDTELEVVSYRWFIWPFTETTDFVIKCKIYKKVKLNI